MQAKLKLTPSPHIQQSFKWSVSSTSIDFMKVSRSAFSRDGSSSNCDASAVSPLPAQKPAPQRQLKVKS